MVTRAWEGLRENLLCPRPFLEWIFSPHINPEGRWCFHFTDKTLKLSQVKWMVFDLPDKRECKLDSEVLLFYGSKAPHHAALLSRIKVHLIHLEPRPRRASKYHLVGEAEPWPVKFPVGGNLAWACVLGCIVVIQCMSGSDAWNLWGCSLTRLKRLC